MVRARSDAQPRRQARSASGDVRRTLKWFLSLSVALPALLSFPAWAAEWDIVPTVSVGEIYTDNVSLSPDALKQDDWITQVIPGISIAATGTGLRFSATYAPDILYYARGQRDNQVYQRGNARVSAELARQLLFVDAGGGVDQYDASLQSPLTTSNVNTTGNRATVRSYFVSPYLSHDFGSDAQAEARFTESVVNSDDISLNSLSNSVADRINLRLKSGPAYKLLAWHLDYLRENIDYESAPDISSEVITADARRLITPTVGLLAQVGYDVYKVGDIAPESEGPSWSAGFDWTPSPRSRLAVAAGHRFYGDVYLLDFTHRTRLTAWSAIYSESVTTTRSEFFTPVSTSTAGYLNALFASQFSDPVARQKVVEDFIASTGLPQALSAPANFFSNQLSLVKRWQASAGILGARNVVIANVFKETSEGLAGNVGQPTSGDFTASNEIIQTGTSLLWNWRIAAQNAWNLGGAYGRNEFPGTSRIDNLTFVGMGLTRQFQPRLYGSVNYRRQQNDSSESASSYTENAVFATVRKRF
jgi:uncharacterized protein (PEP-CTERM system associated)